MARGIATRGRDSTASRVTSSRNIHLLVFSHLLFGRSQSPMARWCRITAVAVVNKEEEEEEEAVAAVGSTAVIKEEEEEVAAAGCRRWTCTRRRRPSEKFLGQTGKF